MKFIISLFLFLYCFNFLQAQECIYEEFGINEGLPSSQVYDLYQDKNGILWIATDRGLANFNGYEIQTFGVNDGILNPVVLDFYPQKNGTIFCATYTGKLFYFHEDFDGFRPYAYNHLLQLKSNQTITNVYIDEDDTIHISCDTILGKFVIAKDGKILQMPEKVKQHTSYKMSLDIIDDQTFCYYTKGDVPNETTAVTLDVNVTLANEIISLNHHKTYIFKTSLKVYILDEEGAVVKTIASDKKPITIKKIDESHFFTGYFYGGGVIRDLEGNVVTHFLKDKSVSDFLIDHDGGYWFSTLHNGIFYVKAPEIKSFQTNVHSPIWTLTKRKDELYVGYSTGEVLKMDSSYTFSAEQKLANNSKAFVEYDSIHDQLYVHSGRMFYKRGKDKERNYLIDDSLLSYAIKISEPSKEGLVISHQNRITVLETDKTFFTNKIGTRVEDAAFWKDEIYIGTPLGVKVYKNDSLYSLEKIHPIFKNRVDDIDVNEEKNEIYFATLGAGIIIYNKNTEEIRTITEQDGLSNDIINELNIENKDELWVCTNSGLNKIKFTKNNTFEITGLKSSNGLLNDGISDVEVINDIVWIASKKGLIHAPKSLFNKKFGIKSYYLQVKQSYVNDVEVDIEKLKNLTYEENRIAFLVEGISFKNSKELLYKYMLEGLDDKWYFTKNRQIIYPALPYGNYTLKVAATTSKKNENLTYIEVPIHIKAPFWKQAWFVISTIAAAILLIYLFFKYRILSYNRDIIRELLRLIVKKIKRKEKYFKFKEAGKEIRIKTDTILYVKSSGNYIELITETKNYTIRKKIGEFIDLMPDPLEYLRIHRSYIIRIDKVAEKNSKEVTINGEKLPVSNSYVEELNSLIF